MDGGGQGLAESEGRAYAVRGDEGGWDDRLVQVTSLHRAGMRTLTSIRTESSPSHVFVIDDLTVWCRLRQLPLRLRQPVPRQATYRDPQRAHGRACRTVQGEGKPSRVLLRRETDMMIR